MKQIASALNGLNTGDLFQIFRDGSPRTRSELADLTGFSRATVSNRLDELVASGLLAPVSDAVSTGGRPPARVALNSAARLVAAADLGATHATVAIANLSGEVLAKTTAGRPITDGPMTTLDWLADTVVALTAQIDRSVQELIAIGIGLPGPVEHATGRPTNPPIMPGWDDFDVPGHLASCYDVPVLVDNDVNVMALGEQARAWNGIEDMIFVKVSTGIGSGIISGGVLQRGADGSAGDIGHISSPGAEGRSCRCGNVGCLEAIAGVPGIILRLAEEGCQISNAPELIARGNAGDPAVMWMSRQVGREIGHVLNMCVSIMNPSLIVVGGALAASEILIAGMREVVYSRSMPLATRNLQIAASRVGKDAGVIGASVLALSYALAPTQVDNLPDIHPQPIEARANVDDAVLPGGPVLNAREHSDVSSSVG